MRLLLFAVAISLVFNCSDTVSLAGGSSTVGNPKLIAKVVTSDGSLAIDAIVRVRSQEYHSSEYQLLKSQLFSHDATTDSMGYFSLSSIDTGKYFIEITDNKSQAVLLPCTVRVDDSTIDLGTAHLASYFSIKGVSGQISSNVGGFVRVIGLERVVPIAVDGAFEINNLPAGSYTIQILPEGVAGGSIVWRSVSGTAGSSFSRSYSYSYSVTYSSSFTR